MDTTTSIFLIEYVSNLIFGWLLSWSLGLVPALIYRYVIFRKPIEKKKVFWRLAPVVIVLMFIYKLIISVLSGTDPNPNPVPWVIIYYIGKWIMTRNYISNQNVGGIINWDKDCTIQVADSSFDSNQKSNEILPPEITCPNCKVILELDNEERMTKKVICPKCNYKIFE